MKANTQVLIAAIIALACFLPFSEVLAETLVYKGAVLITGHQTSENFTDIEPPTKMKFRKKIRMIVILSTTGPEKSIFYLDPKAKTSNSDNSSLSKLPVNFFGVNGKPSLRFSTQSFVTNNFTTSVDRDSAGGDDTNTTKAGSISGNLRSFTIDATPLFAAKLLRGSYTTTRCSDVVPAPTAGFDPGSEFTTFVERITLRISPKDTKDHLSSSVASTSFVILGELFGLGYSFESIGFAPGFEAGVTSAWASAAP